LHLEEQIKSAYR